jgi:hypothetical protein
MINGALTPWGYRIGKRLILALLIMNAALYAAAGRLSAALDSLAWLMLLLLFQVESECGESRLLKRFTAVIHAVRAAAILGLALAGSGFLREHEWLDVMNSVLWIALVLLLECEVRLPGLVARWYGVFLTMGGGLLAALSGLVVAWVWQGEWFEAYDAMLWIIAFATLEVDLLSYARPGQGRNR